MSVQIHRRETRTSGGVQIKGNSDLVPEQLFNCYTDRLFLIAHRLLHCLCTETAQKARRGQSGCPTSAFGNSGLSARPNDVRVTQQTPSESVTSESARSRLGKENGRPRLRGAISHRQALQRPRLRRRLQLAGNPAGRDCIHRILDDRICETVAAVPTLKRAELKALRAGRNPQQHHAAFAFRTSGPADRKQARFGTCSSGMIHPRGSRWEPSASATGGCR
jgi:hypothetical protein